MNRKERINTLIKELDEQYQPDEKFKTGLKPLINNLYDPAITEELFGTIITEVENTYRRNQSHRGNLESAKGMEKVGGDICEMGRLYRQQSKGMGKMVGSLSTIVDAAPKLQTLLDETVKQGGKILEAQKESTQLITEATKKIEEMKQDLEAKTVQHPYLSPKKPN